MARCAPLAATKLARLSAFRIWGREQGTGHGEALGDELLSRTPSVARSRSGGQEVWSVRLASTVFSEASLYDVRRVTVDTEISALDMHDIVVQLLLAHRVVSQEGNVEAGRAAAFTEHCQCDANVVAKCHGTNLKACLSHEHTGDRRALAFANLLHLCRPSVYEPVRVLSLSAALAPESGTT